MHASKESGIGFLSSGLSRPRSSLSNVALVGRSVAPRVRRDDVDAYDRARLAPRKRAARSNYFLAGVEVTPKRRVAGTRVKP